MRALSFLLPGMFYPVRMLTDTIHAGPYRVVMDKVPLTLYRNGSASLVAHSDVCPHQGASLSATGWVDKACGSLFCGYHGFRFDNGAFMEIPNSNGPRAPRRGRHHRRPRAMQPMDLRPCLEDEGHVFVGAPSPSRGDPDYLGIYYPPEHYNKTFRGIHGMRKMAANQHALTENLLDCLHISYVHSFGSRVTPLPMHVQYHSLTNTSGRSTFTYRPRPGSLSSWIGRGRAADIKTKVVVENEFHLPTTTITRVLNDQATKTVLTRAVPVDDHTTLLFWSVYRNFWTESWGGLGDWILSWLMELTIDEDAAILRHVYQDEQSRRGPLHTKYDVTIRQYRACVDKWMQDHHPLG